jgi:hypothetical protein
MIDRLQQISLEHYRVVTDRYSSYEGQVRRWWWPSGGSRAATRTTLWKGQSPTPAAGCRRQTWPGADHDVPMNLIPREHAPQGSRVQR